ncbi:hypothetical protein SAMN04489729_1687 [Amycolatopsis lurida]|nr:hypothetical protein [Amycolatopsis lurida]SEC48425.1 hypothetical protein SAMN04489729_1687 [Amycolatopsis lurida]
MVIRGRLGRLTLVLVGLSVVLVGEKVVVVGLFSGAGSEIPGPLRSRKPGAAKPVIQKATSTITATRIPMATPGLTVDDWVFCWSGRLGQVIGFTFRADLDRRSDEVFPRWVPTLSGILRLSRNVFRDKEKHAVAGSRDTRTRRGSQQGCSSQQSRYFA